MFNFHKSFISIVAILIALQISSFAKEYPKVDNMDSLVFLNNQELSELFKGGSTIIGTNLKFNKESIKNYHDDNTFDGTVASGKKNIAGTWAIENNMICETSKYTKEKKCKAIYKDGDYFITVQTKKMISTLKFKLK